MANYISSCRSNYVRLKDGKEEEFSKKCDLFGFNLMIKDLEDGKKLYGLMNEEEGLRDYYTTEDENGNFEDDNVIDWGKDFGPLLAEGEILHLTESGYEKMRYLSGYGMFIRSDNQVKTVNIHNGGSFVRNFLTKHKSTMTDCSY